MLVAFQHVINFAGTLIIINSIQKRLSRGSVVMMITFVLAHVTSSLTKPTLPSVILNQNAFQTRCFVIMISLNQPRLTILNALESIKFATVSTCVLMVPMNLGQTVFTRIAILVPMTW